MSKEIAEEYASSLADLTVNSKPLINMLTILAEENIDHAGVIVDTVEKHLEKVHPEIKLPVLYLVDSIIKNVGGAYTQKFSQIIVNMFTRTFKQVDEKIRSQMFKLRETWHEVFPATKLYQLDVKVNLIDPAWPIQAQPIPAQPQQSNIHVNPTFLKKPVATTSAPTTSSKVEDDMLSILAKKEQELLMLQQKKIEMELEQTRRQLEMAERNVKKSPAGKVSPSLAVTIVNAAATATAPPATALPATAPPATAPPATAPSATEAPLSVKQRLGPPVNRVTSGARIAPVSGPLAGARRDPRLLRTRAPVVAVSHHTAVPLVPAVTVTPILPMPPTVPPPPIAPNVFDIKPLDRVTKRKNVITIDVNPETSIPRDPRRRDPRLDKRNDDRPRRERVRDKKRDDRDKKIDLEKNAVDKYIDKFADPKKINKLPPIPKINRDEPKDKETSPVKKKKDKDLRNDKRKKRERDASDSKDSPGSSPEKKVKLKEVNRKFKAKEERLEPDAEKPAENEVVAFKELKNYNKERYMRRNKEKSESPENIPLEKEQELRPRVDSTNVPDVIVENKDIDLRVLPTAVPEAKPAPVVQKRASIDALENKPKKAKHEKFHILFGNEDVDLRQLPPKVDEPCPPPPSITESPKTDANTADEESESIIVPSPRISPKERDWTEVKAKSDESKKTPTKLDLVRAKLAEATKGKDRMNKSFYNKQNGDKERRRTISSEDMDLRAETLDDFNPADHKKTISIIMSQAKQQFNDGQLDKNQYETLMYQVMQINEQLKLKEAKQKESLEMSKLKLKAHIEEENNKIVTPKSSPKEQNRFGDIDERVVPSICLDKPPDSINMIQDSDMRMNTVMTHDSIDGPKSKGLLPRPPMMTLYMPPYGPAPMWRGQPRPRHDEYAPRRMRGPAPPYYRGKFDNRLPRPPFDARIPMFPAPKMGICQGENPLKPYERLTAPPPLGAPGFMIPPTDIRVLEYIDQDPVKTIQIDGILREIRFYGDIAVIMLDWDDPREIKFLPGSRRITFDNKDSVMVSFNEPYKQVEIDDQVFDIRFGAPTRELYINGKWYECLFGAQPMGVIIEGKPHLIHLEGPLPQVDIGKTKRTDLVAGKINMIVDGVHMCPLFLDAKVQKVNINGKFLTIRFVDAFTTVLINEMPFHVKFGDLPKPIYFGNEKHFIRFSDVPRHMTPGSVRIIDMEGSGLPIAPAPALPLENVPNTELNHSPPQRPNKTPSPDGESQGLDILASVMPTGMAPATGEYFLAEPLFSKSDKIPGLEPPSEETPSAATGLLRDINVNDLFAQLVATGIVKAPEQKPEKADEETKIMKGKDDKNVVHKVDLLKPETLRTKQPGLVTRLYGGMQCSGCGARFAPEHTVRYSQHLDWHFRQNRRERDSARRAHSRRWHYDTSDWLRYEELEDLDEREKSWFESGTAEGESESHEATEVPSVAAGAPADRQCALCGDSFDQFFNEDLEEWHLRNSVRHDDQNYHPMCYEDYKASLAKEERKSPLENSTDEVVAFEKEAEPIEIKDVDETVDQSDNESVVEVVEPEGNEPVEIDEGDEDDVVLKAEPVEQVVVDDEADTDDETSAARAERDRAAEIDFSKVKVKQEPLDPGESPRRSVLSLSPPRNSWGDDVEILDERVEQVLVDDDADTDDETKAERRRRDELVYAELKIKQELVDPDDEPIITAEEEAIHAGADTTRVTVQSSIDGNVQLEATPAHSAIIPLGGIRINITKSLPTLVRSPPQDDGHHIEDSSADEPLPPGEEPVLEYTLKPNLQNVHFSRQPPVRKGNELSGLCSVM